MEDFPVVSTALLDRLATLFPDKSPRLDDSERLVWYKAGQTSVVQFLREVHKDQQERK